MSRSAVPVTFVEALEGRRLFAASVAGYVQTNLVSDGVVPAVTVDDNLKNPWGVAYSSSGPFWVADNGTSVATLYDGNGTNKGLVIGIPGAGGGDSAPTGQVFNGTSSFVVGVNGKTGPASFIFVGEDGGVSGWNTNVDPNAVLVRDDSASGAVYKGATMATLNGKPTLYVTDFHNNKIVVLDGTFKTVSLKNAFVDKTIPKGFAPFNVQAVGKNLYVTYAKQDSAKHDDVAGPGNGYVDVFNTSGKLIRRLPHSNVLNSPWGVTFAPKNFGTFGGAVLVGQFGSGQIAAYDAATGRFKGLLRDQQGKPVVNDGLWSLKFGNGGDAGPTNALFFTAGLNDEADGLLGKLAFKRPVTAT